LQSGETSQIASNALTPLARGGDRQPDAELKLDRGLGKANLAQSTYPVRSVWLANPEGMGGPDSQRGISLRRKP